MYSNLRLLYIGLLLMLFAPASAYGQWTFISEDIWGPNDLAVHDDVLVVTCNGRTCEAPIYVSDDAGETWITPLGGHGGARVVAATPDGFILQESSAHNYAGSADGSTWTTIDDTGTIVTAYCYDPVADVLYATTQNVNMMISRDRGLTWTDAGVASSDDELTFVHARGDRIITGYHGYRGTTHLSLDGGSTWTDAGVLGPVGGYVADDGDIYVLQNVGGTLSATTTLFRSRDDGATWTQLHEADAPGLRRHPTPSRTRTSVYVEGETILYTANARVFISRDDGETWEEFSDGLVPADDKGGSSILEYAMTDEHMFIVLRGDHGDVRDSYGVYRRPLEELGLAGTSTTASELDLQAWTFELQPAYPNPFRRQTALTFTLDRPGPVRLAVYDVLGREVAVLAEGRFAAGSHERRWRARHRPAGLYLVRLVANGRVQTRAVTLLQ